MRRRAGAVDVLKVKAHLGIEDVWNGDITYANFQGNNVADKYA